LMAAKAKLKPEQIQFIGQVLAARCALPSDKEMARDMRVSVWTIRWHMTQILQRSVVSKTHKAVKLLGCRDPESSPTSNAIAS
jgi:hypothetical protein